MVVVELWRSHDRTSEVGGVVRNADSHLSCPDHVDLEPLSHSTAIRIG